ncbi:MAG: hypothetical protein NTV34_00230 [Proteobacteria bacterium]|nr:hypothetical protein [Pseudomonadota bacterium]
MKTIMAAAALLAFEISIFGCASTPKSISKDSKKSLQQRAARQKEATSQAQVAAQMNSKNVPSEELAVWINRMSSVDTIYTIKDRQYVGTLAGAPKQGSLAEVALVIGLIRDIVTPPGGQSTFDRIDANLPNNIPPSNNASSEKGVDVIQVLKTASMLKNAAVYGWAWNASLLAGNSELFRQRLTEVIQTESTLWQEIFKKTNPNLRLASAPNDKGSALSAHASAGFNENAEEGSLASPPASGGLPAASVPAAGLPLLDPTSPAVDIPSTEGGLMAASPEDVDSSNVIMGKAQEAASSENYSKAVDEASKIKASSPQYSVAQENIRQWSNRAVTDLRKKAAFEYRTAASTSDPVAKKTALKKTKGYLEESLKKYPNASNLDTVRDNLKMVESEIQ